MTTMTNTILQQVTAQVKNTIKAVNSARPKPNFDYVPTTRNHDHSAGVDARQHSSSDRRQTRELRHCLNIVRNSFPMHGLVQEIGTNLKASRRILLEKVHSRAPFGSGAYLQSFHTGREVNPTGMIRLPLQFGNKIKARKLEVDFLVVDVPITYNVILGRPTLHKVKADITSYLLQLQLEADDGSVETLQGDQRIARECYLLKGRIGRRIKVGRGSFALDDRVLIVAAIVHNGLVITAFVCGALAIQWGGVFRLAQTVIFGSWRFKFNLLQILARSTSTMAVFNILDVGLKIALLMKIIRGQGLKELLEAFRVVLMVAMTPLPAGAATPFSEPLRPLCLSSASPSSVVDLLLQDNNGRRQPHSFQCLGESLLRNEPTQQGSKREGKGTRKKE
ncbi:hypothetical protein Cgig2_034011 [Carnegiea gigantea]|uniref:Uncharacterized protein n=1 Tax=Carnegiea gigantea TaxID=171969 RepID=A0A9Q1JXH6_9CARY|nr:hypothetical protein Cgig2_034011 [Carnegiea gigantea]